MTEIEEFLTKQFENTQKNNEKQLEMINKQADNFDRMLCSIREDEKENRRTLTRTVIITTALCLITMIIIMCVFFTGYFYSSYDSKKSISIENKAVSEQVTSENK